MVVLFANGKYCEVLEEYFELDMWAKNQKIKVDL
jgi:hypothetical protein